MRKIILTLILVFAFANLKADDFNLKLKDINSPKLTLSKITAVPCDLCGCYLGIDPNYNLSTAGFRYRYRGFTGVSNIASVNVDHESPAGQKEKYNTYEIWGRYYITPKLQLSASLPLGNNNIGGERFSGLGDLNVQLQYHIFNTNLQANTKFRNRLFLGGGIKFPTGKYNEKSSDGDIEPHFQAGTGSFDYILLATYLAKMNKVGLSTDVVYKMNTKNSNDYKFGNEFNLDASLFYEIVTKGVVFLPNAGVYFEQAPEGEMSGVPDPSSGGNVLFGSFGIDLSISKITLKLSYQAPISQKLNGGQPENDGRFISGFGFSF